MTCCQVIVKKIVDEYEIKVGDVIKVVPNLGNKKICDSLQKSSVVFAFRNELTKIHRALQIKQFDRMKKYIDFNTEKKKMLLMIL